MAQPSYRGVRQRTPHKWVSEIHDPTRKKPLWIGSFKTPEMAARAFDFLAYYFRGPIARLNFPQALHTHPTFSPNATIHEIRELACHAAAAGRHGLGGGGGGSISGHTDVNVLHVESGVMESALVGEEIFHVSGVVSRPSASQIQFPMENFPQALHTLPTFPSNATIHENRELACHAAAAGRHGLGGGGGGSISGHTDVNVLHVESGVMELVGEEIFHVPGVVSGPSVSQIESLKEMPMNSPWNQTIMEDTWYIDPYDGDTYGTMDLWTFEQPLH